MISFTGYATYCTIFQIQHRFHWNKQNNLLTKLISGGAMCCTFCHAVILPALQVRSQTCALTVSPLWMNWIIIDFIIFYHFTRGVLFLQGPLGVSVYYSLRSVFWVYYSLTGVEYSSRGVIIPSGVSFFLQGCLPFLQGFLLYPQFCPLGVYITPSGMFIFW